MRFLKKVLHVLGLRRLGLREELEWLLECSEYGRLRRPSKLASRSWHLSRKKQFAQLLAKDPQFFVLHRAVNLSATWLSAIAVAMLHELARPEGAGQPQDEQLAALAFYSRLANDLWAIIELVEKGYDIQARALTRSYLEHVDVLICCIHDKKLTSEFVSAVEPEEANRFWHKYVSKNKMKRRVADLVTHLARLPRSELIDELRSGAEIAGSTILHPSMMAGIIAALGDEGVDYDNGYPLFPRPVAASVGIFRTLSIHHFWLFLAMGGLPRQGFAEWGSLIKKTDISENSTLKAIIDANAQVLGFLVDKHILFTDAEPSSEA